MLEVWREAGELLARLPAYRRLLWGTQRRIEKFLSSHDPVTVAYSFGKDSTVLLHLARQIRPDIKAYHVYQGSETPDTTRFRENFPVAIYGTIDIVRPDQIFEEGAEYYGWYAENRPRKDITAAAWHRRIASTPWETYHKEHGVKGVLLGIRAQESRGRAALCRYRDLVCPTTKPPRMYPLLYWKVQDIWAYIASNNLPYNATYDRETLGFTRYSIRVSPLLADGTHRMRGLLEWLRLNYPAYATKMMHKYPLFFTGGE
jgi:3'-phosphoadenosine 5'-phosphosulfate sulfotransferase (PAPS reductase)/FAD synthetase